MGCTATDVTHLTTQPGTMAVTTIMAIISDMAHLVMFTITRTRSPTRTERSTVTLCITHIRNTALVFTRIFTCQRNITFTASRDTNQAHVNTNTLVTQQSFHHGFELTTMKLTRPMTTNHPSALKRS